MPRKCVVRAGRTAPVDERHRQRLDRIRIAASAAVGESPTRRPLNGTTNSRISARISATRGGAPIRVMPNRAIGLRLDFCSDGSHRRRSRVLPQCSDVRNLLQEGLEDDCGQRGTGECPGRPHPCGAGPDGSGGVRHRRRQGARAAQRPQDRDARTGADLRRAVLARSGTAQCDGGRRHGHGAVGARSTRIRQDRGCRAGLRAALLTGIARRINEADRKALN